MTRTDVVIIDDHPLLAAGLERQLTRSGLSIVLLDPSQGPTDLVATAVSHDPSCVVLDLGLPVPGGGMALIEPLVAVPLRVMVLTGHPEHHLWARALGLGAEAVVSKGEPLGEIVETVRLVAGGHTARPQQRAELTADHDWRFDPFSELSPREQQVLAGLMEGHPASALAARHFVSVATIRAQIRSVLTKLGVGSQLEAVALAHHHRWSLGGERL